MFKKILAFLICGIGILLPPRLRCLYSEVLGWITQFLYLSYFKVLKFIINELRNDNPIKNNER